MPCAIRESAAIIWCIDNYKSATTPCLPSAPYGYVCFGGLSSSPDYIRTFYRRGIARSRLLLTLGLQWRSKPCSLVPRETCRRPEYLVMGDNYGMSTCNCYTFYTDGPVN